MKLKNISKIIPVIIILLSFLIGIYFYPQMPELIASHWNTKNQVDGYVSKAVGLFLMPFISLFLYILFLWLPKTDPYKKNFKQFIKYYRTFIIIIFLFLFYLYIATILWNLNYQFNMIQILSPAFAVVFFYAGILTQHAKRNWFVGVRTPWTLSSDIVWDKTHHLGGKLFKISALVTLLSVVLPQYAIFFIIVPILAFSVFLFLYSYLEYKKLS